MSGQFIGLPNLQGVYNAGVAPPHVTLNGGAPLTIVEPTATSGLARVAQVLARGDGIAGAVGDGVAQDLQVANAAGALVTAFRVAAEWSDASAGSEDTEVVFSTRVAGLLLDGLRMRASGVDTQLVTPFALVISPNGNLSDGLRISTIANDVFVIPQNAADAFNLGNTIADPSVNLNRTNARAFDIIPLGTVITSSTPGNWIDLASNVVIDTAPTGSFGGFVSVSGEIRFRQAGSAFGAGNLFKIQGTIKNEIGSFVTIGSQYTFVHVGTYLADGAFAQSNLFHRVCLFAPTWEAANGATMAVNTINVGGFLNPNIGAGVTVTHMRDWEWAAGVFNGVVTNRSHLYFPATNTPAATIFSGIESRLAASANHRFIRHLGTAESDINGTINLTGAALLNLGTEDALGGGALATLGLIGGTGPTGVAQVGWGRIESGGVTSWVPLFR